jgi:integrase
MVKMNATRSDLLLQLFRRSVGTSFNDAKHAAKMQESGLHLHDLRGTAATKLYATGIPIRSIAEILAWDEEGVEKIINRYVGNNAATLALIKQLDESRTKSARLVQE